MRNFWILNINCYQGSDRIDSFWFAEVHKKILICEVNQNLFFYFWFTWANHFIFWFWFIVIFIHFDLRFKVILFILIRFDFDSSRITTHPRIMIHLRIKIKSNQKSKVGESWFTHLRIIGWFDFESKANQSESRIKLVWALIDTESLSIWSLPYCLLKNSLRTGELPVWFSPLNSVSTGLLLGVLLLHLIPDANGDTAEALEDFGATTNYPVSMLLVGVGFFIVTLVELLVERCNEKGKN